MLNLTMTDLAPHCVKGAIYSGDTFIKMSQRDLKEEVYSITDVINWKFDSVFCQEVSLFHVKNIVPIKGWIFDQATQSLHCRGQIGITVGWQFQQCTTSR